MLIIYAAKILIKNEISITINVKYINNSYRYIIAAGYHNK